MNVGINYWNDPQNYTLGNAGLDFGIGAFYGGVGFLIGLPSAPHSTLGSIINFVLRPAALGLVSVAEGGTNAFLKGESYTRNEAAWGFITGIGTGLLAHGIATPFNNHIQRIKGVTKIERSYYRRSINISRNSIHTMREANRQAAIRYKHYAQQFPESRMIGALAKNYLSKTRQLNKSIYQPPLNLPRSGQRTIATLQGISAGITGILADNEFFGLFPTPSLIPNY